MIMDVGIIIDSSSSVRRANFGKVKNFLLQLVDKMDVNDSMVHVGVIHYNHKAYLDWNFKSKEAMNANDLKKAIEALKYKPGGTRTDVALATAEKELLNYKNGMRPGVPHVLLVITDGKTSSRSVPYSKVLEPFKVLRFSNLNST